MLYDPEYLQTIIVTGPRGSGKSTLVRHCLAGKGGVVRVCLNTRSYFSIILEVRRECRGNQHFLPITENAELGKVLCEFLRNT